MGGIQTHTWKLSLWLHKLGHEVHILTSGKFLGRVQVETREDIQLIRIPYFPGRKLPVLKKYAEEFFFNLSAQRWLRQNAPTYDVVHIQGRSGISYAGKRQNIGVICTFHGLIYWENKMSLGEKRGIWSDRVHARWASRLERRALQHADAVIVVSNQMRNQLDYLDVKHGSPIYRISNGVDIPVSEIAASQEPAAILLFVGRLDPLKGVFSLLEAMKQVKPPVELVIIGDGGCRSELEKQVAAYQLGGRVRFLGSQDQESVFSWIRRSFALVLPSRHESQGIVLLEANACGKPVIASRIPGIDEVLEHELNGLMTPVDQPAELAEAINWMYAHPEEARSMGARGLQLVRDRFTWERIAQQTLEIYQQVSKK